MNCPHRIPPSGTLHITIDQNLIVAATPDQPCATIVKTSTDAASLHLNPILVDTTAKVVMTSTEAIPGHTTRITDDITGVVYDTHTQTLTHIILAMTLHIAEHLHIEALHLPPEITADHALNQPTNPPRKPYTVLHHIPADHKVKHVQKGIYELQ